MRVLVPEQQSNEAEFVKLQIGEQFIALYDHFEKSPRFTDAFSYDFLEKGVNILVEVENLGRVNVPTFSLFSPQSLILCLNLNDFKFRSFIREPFF